MTEQDIQATLALLQELLMDWIGPMLTAEESG